MEFVVILATIKRAELASKTLVNAYKELIKINLKRVNLQAR